MVYETAPGIHVIKVRLPGSPLKNLNSYVFSSNGQSLLIDTGFNQPACLEDLRGGIAELGLDMEKTDIFLTHLHADHCGLVSQIASAKSKVYMGHVDLEMYQQSALGQFTVWHRFGQNYVREGFPESDIAETLRQNPAKNMVDNKFVAMAPVRDGDEIRVGNRTLRCVFTPGHTPGHTCLYEEATKTMVLGDHVLFDITPNITSWGRNLPNSLKHYLASLDKVENMDVQVPLPAHRESGDKTFAQRVAELKKHHVQRLDELTGIITAQPGLTGYELAARMKWSIRAKNWQEFPPAQKWFAMGEAMAHLDYLAEEGRICRQEQKGVRRYFV